MGAEIKDMFFTDKLRSIVTMLFMAIIVVLIAGSWAFPRQTSSNLDEKSLNTLQEVSKQLKSAADNFERQASESALLRESLNRTLDMQKGERDDVYGKMLQRYGYDPTNLEAPGAGYSGAAAPPSTVINVGVLPSDDGKRSVNISTSSSNPGGDRQLPNAAGKNQGGSNGSPTPVPAGGPDSPH
jgi:hypothetical protein